MAPRLSQHPMTRIDEDEGHIAGARAGHKVACILLVPGRIRDDELSFRSCKIAVSNINRNALLPFRAQAVGQQREIDAFAAAPFVFALRAFDLVFTCALSCNKYAADQSVLATGDVVGWSDG